MVASHVGRDIGLRVRGSVLRELTALREENERLRVAIEDALFHLRPPAHNDTARGVLEVALTGSFDPSHGTPRTG